MTVALPIGYVSILEAADMLLPAMYAGVDCRLIAIVPNGYLAGKRCCATTRSGRRRLRFEPSEFDENNT
jgi:hypothetical protein